MTMLNSTVRHGTDYIQTLQPFASAVLRRSKHGLVAKCQPAAIEPRAVLEIHQDHHARVLITFPVKVAARRVDRDEIIRLRRQRDFQKPVVRLMFDGGGGEKG